ncbi:guanine deaminase [Rhodotorula toruloides]|uniref:Guanine deaminase n=1 Tax=Rhodotorula toruloides TaxID=5286 RepID=A0A511KI56_RHOTO|nr:guanine deaminase [Rhodotorula toruloides]
MLDPEDIALVLRGTVVSPQADRSLSIREDCTVVVDRKGFIAAIGESADRTLADEVDALVGEGELGQDKVVELGDGWILPGFVVTHIHAPQYPNAGMALDKPLMEWLEAYTFAAELRIDRDPVHAQRVYKRLVQRLLENGTTAASVFGTISVEANLTLARVFLHAGIRAQIGKVAMDQYSQPSHIETTDSSLTDTRRFIESMHWLVASLPEERRIVEPVVTPRFVPTCSVELMKGLSELAKETGVRIQSHMCESQGMVDVCHEMLGGKSDVEVLDDLGLLNERSLMAHCTHSSADDLSRLSRTGTAIASCPLSNVYFSAERQLPLREAWDAGVKIGLGSDISGGYRVGIDENMRWAVGVSRLREGERQRDLRVKSDEDEQSSSLAISWKEAIYLATLGGAQALGVDKEHGVGTFEVGSAFDAQWIQLGHPRSRVDWFDAEEENQVVKRVSPEEKLEKWFCNGSEVDRKAVWVQGKLVYSRPEPW